jgi:hypothetical protein
MCPAAVVGLTPHAESRLEQNRGMPPNEEESPVIRASGISYLRIPAPDATRAASFYEAAFGWTVGGDPAEPRFPDGTGRSAAESGFCPDAPRSARQAHVVGVR